MTEAEKMRPEDESLSALRAERDALSAEIGRLKATGQDFSRAIALSRDLTERIRGLEGKSQTIGGAAGKASEPCCGVLEQTAQFEELRDEWNALVGSSETPVSPFMRWGWLFPWWKHFGGDKRLRLVTVRSGHGELVGLAPLMLGLRESGRFYPRTLAFVGSGHEGPMGQDFHIILGAGAGRNVEDLIWSEVLARSSEWDVLRMWKVAEHPAALATLMGAARNAPNGLYLRPAAISVWGRLPASFEEFLSEVPSQTERNLMRNHFARLEASMPDVAFGVWNTRQDVATPVESVMDFSVARLGADSTWGNARYRACLSEMVAELGQDGTAEVAALSIGGRVVAGAVCLLSGETLAVFAPGFDPAYGVHNVMHALYAKLIENGIGRGVRRLDWLSDHPYQRRIVTQYRHTYHCDVFSNESRGFELSARRVWLRSLRRCVRALVHAVSPPLEQRPDTA